MKPISLALMTALFAIAAHAEPYDDIDRIYGQHPRPTGIEPASAYNGSATLSFGLDLENEWIQVGYQCTDKKGKMIYAELKKLGPHKIKIILKKSEMDGECLTRATYPDRTFYFTIIEFHDQLKQMGLESNTGEKLSAEVVIEQTADLPAHDIVRTYP